jgi:hypothetical protein
VTENWGARSRLSLVGYALLATAPIWPVLQPREPILDEMLAPGEVAILVPVVLVFPVAWALLSRTERVGQLFGWGLVLMVLTWSSWTAEFGEYATPPNIDDGLRWYLLTAAAVVVAGVAWDARKIDRRWVVGVACWVLGLGITVTVPVLDDGPMPPEDLLLPVPRNMTVVSHEATCTPYCTRNIVVTGEMPAADLARQLGEHLAQAKGWQVTSYDFTPEPHLTCRKYGWLVNPYKVCGSIRVVDDRRIEIHFGNSNNHNPIY